MNEETLSRSREWVAEIRSEAAQKTSTTPVCIILLNRRIGPQELGSPSLYRLRRPGETAQLGQKEVEKGGLSAPEARREFPFTQPFWR